MCFKWCLLRSFFLFFLQVFVRGAMSQATRNPSEIHTTSIMIPVHILLHGKPCQAIINPKDHYWSILNFFCQIQRSPHQSHHQPIRNPYFFTDLNPYESSITHRNPYIYIYPDITHYKPIITHHFPIWIRSVHPPFWKRQAHSPRRIPAGLGAAVLPSADPAGATSLRRPGVSHFSSGPVSDGVGLMGFNGIYPLVI